MPTIQEIKKYMMDNYKDHLDNSCNVLNLTSIAEDAWQHFYPDSCCNDVPEEYFDMACEVDKVLYKKGLVNQ